MPKYRIVNDITDRYETVIDAPNAAEAERRFWEVDADFPETHIETVNTEIVQPTKEIE